VKSAIIANIEVFVDEVDKFIQVKDIADIPLGFEQEVIARYPEHETWFLYHKTSAPTERLDKIATLLDDCIEMRLKQNDFVDAATPDVFRVSDKENFKIFASLHDKNSEDMFWTSNLIEEHLSKWGIFLSESQSKEAGYSIIHTELAHLNIGEIFYLQSKSTAQSKALLASAVKYAFSMGKSEIVYMVDKNSKHVRANEREAALSIGFRVVGFYQGYKLNTYK
jgi:hypothetical protein